MLDKAHQKAKNAAKKVGGMGQRALNICGFVHWKMSAPWRNLKANVRNEYKDYERNVRS